MTSCSHYLRLLCIGYSGLGDIVQSLSEAIPVNVQVTKNLEHECLNSMITSVFLKLMPVRHFIPLCSGIAEWLLLYKAYPGYWEVKQETRISNSIYNLYINIREITRC